MEQFETINEAAGHTPAIILKEVGKMKKPGVTLLATAIVLSGMVAEERAEAADLRIADLNSSTSNWTQSWQWMIGYFNWYMNNTLPDFRVNHVNVCYFGSTWGDPTATVRFTTENVGGNSGITSASRLTYSVDIGNSGLLASSSAPYWGQPVNAYSKQVISSRYAVNSGIVQIEIHKNSSLPELNYTNNVSRWYVNTSAYTYLDGCYDLVEFN